MQVTSLPAVDEIILLKQITLKATRKLLICVLRLLHSTSTSTARNHSLVSNHSIGQRLLAKTPQTSCHFPSIANPGAALCSNSTPGPALATHSPELPRLGRVVYRQSTAKRCAPHWARFERRVHSVVWRKRHHRLQSGYTRQFGPPNNPVAIPPD